MRSVCAAVLALAPPAAWSLWARRFWILYGNSLGLSNESPFLGLDMLHRPEWVLGLLKWETLGVLMPLGWILLLAARRPHTRCTLNTKRHSKGASSPPKRSASAASVRRAPPSTGSPTAS